MRSRIRSWCAAYPHANPGAVNLTYAGLWRINVSVPRGAPAGNVPVTLRVEGEAAPPILLWAGGTGTDR